MYFKDCNAFLVGSLLFSCNLCEENWLYMMFLFLNSFVRLMKVLYSWRFVDAPSVDKRFQRATRPRPTKPGRQEFLGVLKIWKAVIYASFDMLCVQVAMFYL